MRAEHLYNVLTFRLPAGVWSLNRHHLSMAPKVVLLESIYGVSMEQEMSKKRV